MIEKLRGFNGKLDEFLVEVSFPLLILGFIMATVDLFLHGQMATFGPFKWLWSVVQAIAIDGVFIAIWLRIFTTKWLWATCWKLVFLVPAGLLMAIVAGVVNDIMTYQEVYAIADSVQAMHALQIDIATFTHVRAFLVIFVAILLIPLRKPMAIPDSQVAIPIQQKRPRQRAIVIEEKAPPVAIAEHAEAIEKAPEPTPRELCIARWEASDKSQGVKKAIAAELGMGYSTVKKYIKESSNDAH